MYTVGTESVTTGKVNKTVGDAVYVEYTYKNTAGTVYNKEYELKWVENQTLWLQSLPGGVYEVRPVQAYKDDTVKVYVPDSSTGITPYIDKIMLGIVY